MNWYFNVWGKTFDISSRASRWEFWMWVLFTWIITIVLGFVDVLVADLTGSDEEFFPTLAALFWLVWQIPGLTLTIRRLHDTGRRGWWLFISVVPLIGPLVLLVFMLQASQSGENQYGPNPKGEVARLA